MAFSMNNSAPGDGKDYGLDEYGNAPNLYGKYPYRGGVSIQPSSLSRPAGGTSPGSQLQTPSYARGGYLDDTYASASRDRVLAGKAQGSEGSGGSGWQMVGDAAQALGAASNLYGAFNGGANQPADPSTYPGGGMPKRPHPTAGAKATGDAMADTGNALLMAAPMAGPASPYMAIAGLASKGVGAGFQLYAAMKNADQAEEEYKELLKEWEKMKAREEADYKREVERQRQSDVMGKSAYSAAVADRFASSYGGYRQGGQISGFQGGQ